MKLHKGLHYTINKEPGQYTNSMANNVGQVRPPRGVYTHYIQGQYTMSDRQCLDLRSMGDIVLIQLLRCSFRCTLSFIENAFICTS